MKLALRVILLTAMLLGLPLGGVWLAGFDLHPFLEFPPRTHYVEHPSFSWPVFIGLALVILATTLPFLVRIYRTRKGVTLCPGSEASAPPYAYPFPWWGWLSVVLGIGCWITAWTRIPLLAPFQLYTFTPQWICYIVSVNALTVRRTGKCLLTHRPGYFLMLFPLSAAFWWFFEFLNRFVQNWWYTCGADFSPLQYFVAATLPFSTVLPAVLSTEEWLHSFPRNTAGLEHFLPVRISQPVILSWIMLVVSAIGLLLIGWFPNDLFPLLWVAPLLLMVALQGLSGGRSFFPEIQTGDWRRVYRFCLAALICGFFWELWNAHSLAKWIYSVPYVNRFHLFEMPILGYAGYLPFGLECAVIAMTFLRHDP